MRSLLALLAAALLISAPQSSKASLECDGIWQAGVWTTTAWADGVWTETACGAGGGGGSSGGKGVNRFGLSPFF